MLVSAIFILTIFVTDFVSPEKGNDCVNTLVNFFTKSDDLMLTINAEDFTALGEYVHYNYDVTSKTRVWKAFHNKIDFYYIDLSTNVNVVFHFLYGSNQLNTAAKFIIKIYKLDKKILAVLKQHFIHRVVIIYNDNLYEINELGYVLRGSCDNYASLNLFNTSTYTKIDMLKVATYDYEPFTSRMTKKGLLDQIITTVTDKMGVKLSYIYVDDETGEVYDNGTYDGFWTEFFEKKADFFGGALINRMPYVGYFDATVPAMHDYSYFVVPFVLVEKDRLELNNFDVYIWVLLSASIFIFGIIYLKASTHLETPPHTKGKILMDIFRLEFENNPLWKPRSKTLKLLTISYLFCTFVLNTSYKCKMFNSTVRGESRPKYETLDDLIERDDLKIGLHPVAKWTLSRSENPREKIIGDSSEICSISLQCLNRTAFQQDYATVKFSHTMKYLLPIFYVNQDGIPLLTPLKGNVIQSIYFSFFFRKGHPSFGEFNDKLLRLQDHGFTSEILRGFDAKTKRAFMAALNKEVFRFSKIRLGEVAVIFLVYMWLNVVAVGVFLCEVVYVRVGDK